MAYADAEHLIGHHLRRAQQLHAAAWARLVSPSASPAQYGILAALAERDDLSQRELGELACFDKSTLGELVRRMERHGLVEIARDAADGRRRRVRLTDAGRARHASLRPRVERLNEALLEGRDAEERARLRTAIDSLLESPIARAIDAESGWTAGREARSSPGS